MHTFTSRFFASILLPLSLICLAFLASNAFAQSDQGIASRQFGGGKPVKISDLPPGQLKRSLENLPPAASANALKWLQEISFTGTDLDVLKVDDQGGVYFDDTLLPDPALQQQAATTPTMEATSAAVLADAFILHSRPGSPNKVFIDFDGHVFTNTAWGAGSFSGVPYDIDGNSANFSDAERGRIIDIWHRVAEDLAPFNIDVTTEEPASFNATTGRILVTTDTDATGKAMPSQGAGGVAYVNVFGLSNYHTYYSPALVYYNHLGPGVETYIAEASSHEFGHNLGLSHDGSAGATPTTYYAGHGSGLVSWAPIMGNGYYNNVTEWSKGEYPDANQTQDDLAIIQGKLGVKTDDHGNAIGSGTALLIGATGSIVSSNPELDPHNLLPENKGVINSRTDVDVFTFVAGAGPLSLTLRPAWDAFYRATDRRGANLDIRVELRNAAGSLVTSNDPTTDTKATVSATVGAGTYHLLISGEGVGDLITGYSDYDSLGQYFINGSVVPGGTDGTAPTPNPMTWASPPAATSSSSITMTATVATDAVSAVQYNFQCLAGSSGCTASGWQSSNSYTANGLAASTLYTFNVIARDVAGNQTSAAASLSATTQAPPGDFTPPNPNPMTWAILPAATSSSSITMTATVATDAVSAVQYNFQCLPSGNGCVNSGWQSSNSYTANGLAASTLYTFNVIARDVAGNPTSAAASLSATTQPAPPPPSEIVASSETLVAGTVSGTFANTQTDNGSVQSITERDSSGQTSKRYSYLEHRWNFTLSSSQVVTLYANAWSGGSTDGDTFNFQYSLNGGSSWTTAFNVSSTSTGNIQSFALGAQSGTIIVRVIDTNRVAGHREKNKISIDRLYLKP